ncbi:MAG: uncharacterized protein QOI47_1366 [Actinomycetota bacterium]|jgi:uncharacterized protein (TIGR00251 family)|nr:uncharacterized protein [Actinomycetota bacterium]
MDTDLFDVRDNGTVVLRVHVQPGAGRTSVKGRYGDALKVSVAAPPEKGRANEAVAKLLSEVLGVDAATVSIVGGETNRAKRFLLAGLDADDLRDRLEVALEDAGRQPGSGGRNF